MATVDSTGIQPTTTQGYFNLLASAWRSVYPSLSLTASTPQGQLIGLLAQALADRDQELVDAVGAFSVWDASGRQLDNLMEIFRPEGLYRFRNESDESLRLRYQQELEERRKSAVEQLRGAVLESREANRCEVIENTSATEATVRGITMAPHSICVVAAHDDFAISTNGIADVIYENKPMGIETSGSAEETVRDRRTDIESTVRFEEATAIAVRFATSLTTTADFPTNGATLIGNALVAYFDDLRLGQTYDANHVTALMYGATSGFVQGTTTYLRQEGGGALPSPLAINQYLTLSADHISITLQSA